jgi:DEAD/DEAH box helicase domain-containing protein
VNLLDYARPEDNGRFGVLDIETRYSAQEVGGWNRADRMGVSIACLYDSGTDTMHDYEQNQMDELVEHLKQFDTVIGFNHIKFDYAVLSGLHPFPFNTLPSLDLLIKVHERLGYRLKLDNIAQATLDVGKSADGLMALEWWKQGRLDLITEYCRQDVIVTRDVYLYGRENGHVLFTNKAGQKVKLPVDW